MQPSLGKCPCCDGEISTNALACPFCGHTKSKPGLHYVLKWFAVMVGGIVCVVMDINALASDNMSAVQQAAQIVAGTAFAVGPYIYARATSMIGSGDAIAIERE